MCTILRITGYCGIGLATVAIGATYWPASGIVGLVIIIVVVKKRVRWTAWEHGTARWASLKELKPLIRARRGFILGRLFTGTRKAGPLLRLPHGVHICVTSPTSGGKGVSCVIPFLLDPANRHDSSIVLDVKNGEIYLNTFKQRERFSRVVVLDPFNVVTTR